MKGFSLLLAATLVALAEAHAAQGDERVLAPQQLFTPPPAGSYSLPAILTAPDGRVLDERGQARQLRDLTRGRITLLSFIFTHCTDAVGCPLAFSTLAQVRERLAARAGAVKGAQLVSLSFNPAYDTPDVMRMFAKSFEGGAREPAWHFLTTASTQQLEPLLTGFGQDVSPNLQHTLRVFLIDRQQRVREIYSSAFLLPDVIVNDILTLAGEAR